MTDAEVPTILDRYDLVSDPPFEWQGQFDFYRFLAKDPEPDSGEGFYYRLAHDPSLEEYCLQVILYYRVQEFPYHINDFHPFFSYYDNQFKSKYLLYDSSHHYTREIVPSDEQAFTVRFPWHGYKPGRSLFAAPLQSESFRLDDSILRDWWLQSGKQQLKIRSKFVDPWHAGLRRKHPAARGTFRDEAVCPYCGEIRHLDTMDFDGSLFSLEVTCPSGHPFVSKYDPLSMKMDSAT